MTIFEYVSVLLAIVLGLAVSRAMAGVAKFVASEHRSANDWLVAGWCLGLIFMQVIWWLGGWFLYRDLEVFPLGTIMFWVTATALISLAAYVLVPHTDVMNLGAATPNPTIRPAFYVCLGSHFGIVLANFSLTGASAGLLVVTGVPFALTTTGYFLKSVKSQVIHLLVWLLFLSIASLLVVPSIGADSALNL